MAVDHDQTPQLAFGNAAILVQILVADREAVAEAKRAEEAEEVAEGKSEEATGEATTEAAATETPDAGEEAKPSS